MKVLLVYAHPVESSFNAAIRDRIHASLSPRHGVDLLDLYAEGFDPVMSRAERLGYHDLSTNTLGMADHVARLRSADAVVLCFPAWTFGPPAILKGWLDRIMMPGVGFHLEPGGGVRGGLTHLTKLAGVVTYGQTRLRATLMGDYPRKIIRRYLRHNIGLQKPATFLAHYAMNVSTSVTRERFLDRVGTTMERF